MAKAKKQPPPVTELESAEQRLEKGNRLDRTLEVVAPQWALKRREARARLALDYRIRDRAEARVMRRRGRGGDQASAGGYPQTGSGRTRPSPRGMAGSADKALNHTARKNLRNDLRYLDRYNSIFEALLNRMADNVVASGFNFQAQTDDSGLNRAVEDRHGDWAGGECDVTGRMPLWMMCRTLLRAICTDGDVLFLQMYEGSLQAIEADRVNGKKISDNGITKDGVGRPQKYWVANYHKSGTINYSTAEEHEADKCHFVAYWKRFSQGRGVPAMATTIEHVERIDDYIEAVLIAAQSGACQAGVATTEGGAADGYRQSKAETAAGNVNETDGTGIRTQEIMPGRIIWLKPGEDFKGFTPTQPHDQFAPFLRAMLRIAGNVLGMPLELAAMDFSQTNYSSARAALLQAYRSFRVWQQLLQDKFLKPVMLWRMKAWAQEEGWKAPRGKRAEKGWRRVKLEGDKELWIPRIRYIPPGWEWVDPDKEVKANKNAAAAGMRTLADIAADLGRDVTELIDQRAREIGAAQKVAEKLGDDVTWRDVIPAREAEEAEMPELPEPSTPPAKE